MVRGGRKLRLSSSVGLLVFGVLTSLAWAAPTVKIILVEPDVRDRTVIVGDVAEIKLAARVAPPDATLQWDCSIGEFACEKTSGLACIYVVPTRLTKDRTQVIITVTASDAAGKSGLAQITFALQASATSPTPTVAPTKSPTAAPTVRSGAKQPTPTSTPTKRPTPPRKPADERRLDELLQKKIPATATPVKATPTPSPTPTPTATPTAKPKKDKPAKKPLDELLKKNLSLLARQREKEDV